MLIESFSQSILRWLRIPPGASLRHAGEVSTGSTVDIMNNPYTDTIVGITVDDICIGEEPLTVDYRDGTPEVMQMKLEEIAKEFNDIVKDVAWDLCCQGFSVYKTDITDKNKLILYPYLDFVQFFLTKDKVVVVVDEDNNPIEGVLVFINYNRRGLVKIDDKDVLYKQYMFGINPEPMQLKNVQSTLASLVAAENNLDRYRALMSRPVRLVNVNVGNSVGDQQKDVIDTISSAINANSGSLPSVGMSDGFDDNIPVLPNRNGIGQADVYENIPQYELDKIGDIDHYLNKLTLVTRFPGSYMDFSKNLDETTASLLRGDIRYYKMCNKVRSKIVSTINDFVNASDTFRKYEPCFILTQLPTSEDEDVMSALDNYVDLAEKAENFVIGDNPSVPECTHRLQLLQDLFASSTTSPMLQKWFEDFRDYIIRLGEVAEEIGSDEEGMGGSDGGLDLDSDMGDSDGGFDLDSDMGSDIGFDEDLGSDSTMDFVDESSSGSDVEFVNEPINNMI